MDHKLKPVLLRGGAADAGQDAEFSEDDDFEISGLIVAEEMGFAAGGPALNEEDGVAFMFGASRVPDGDLKFAGIVVDSDEVGLAGAADAKIAENGFLAGEGFLADDIVPGLALSEKCFGHALPNLGSQTQGCLAIEGFFLKP